MDTNGHESNIAGLPSRLPSVSCFVASFAFLFLVAGCGDGRPKRVPVTGTVTLNGQPPPAPGVAFFTSIEPAEGYPRRPGTAKFDIDGKYAVKTFEDADGLIPGRYGVAVYCWKTQQTMENPQGESHLPGRYQDGATSGLELLVEPTARALVYDIPLKTP